MTVAPRPSCARQKFRQTLPHVPWAGRTGVWEGARITPVEHPCLILHSLRLTGHSVGGTASSPPWELIISPSTQLLLPSRPHRCCGCHTWLPVCVCVGGSPWLIETTTHFLQIFYEPPSPRGSRLPQLKCSFTQPMRLTHHSLLFFTSSGDTLQWEAQVRVRSASINPGPRLPLSSQDGSR